MAGIASAPPPPEPKVEGAVSTDTTLTWNVVPRALGYVVRWRRTDSNNWEVSRPLPFGQACLPSKDEKDGSVTFEAICKVVLPHIRVDDWVFGVSSVSRDGFESPVASAVPGGAFHPYIAPPKK